MFSCLRTYWQVKHTLSLVLRTGQRLVYPLTLVLFLTSCFRPNYRPQYVETPCAWRLAADEESTLCNLRWWNQLGDPVLDALITQALQNNQDLQVAISRVLEYHARYGITKSFAYPTIDGVTSYNRVKSSLAAPGATLQPIPGLPPGTPLGLKRINNDFQTFFKLTWELDFWGRIYSATEASYADMLSQVEARRAVVLTLVTSVADAYITLRGYDAGLVVAKKTLKSRYESLDLAQDRFELGETSEMEVKQAESQVEIAAIRVIEFERLIPVQENLLSVLLGDTPHAIARGITIQAFQYPISIPAGLPSDLLRRRPDIIEAEDVMIAANARVTEARTLYFPQINLTGIYGNESEQVSNLLSSPAQMWQYGLTGIMPLFNMGRTGYHVEENVAIRDEALFNYRQTVLNAFREVNDGLINYRMDRALVLEHGKQVQVLNDYLNLAQLRYNEGEIDYLNILDAERSLFDAQLQLVQAQSDSFRAIVELYGALGGGWVIDADSIAVGCPIEVLDSD